MRFRVRIPVPSRAVTKGVRRAIFQVRGFAVLPLLRRVQAERRVSLDTQLVRTLQEGDEQSHELRQEAGAAGLVEGMLRVRVSPSIRCRDLQETVPGQQRSPPRVIRSGRIQRGVRDIDRGALGNSDFDRIFF